MVSATGWGGGLGGEEGSVYAYAEVFKCEYTAREPEPEAKLEADTESERERERERGKE